MKTITLTDKEAKLLRRILRTAQGVFGLFELTEKVEDQLSNRRCEPLKRKEKQ